MLRIVHTGFPRPKNTHRARNPEQFGRISGLRHGSAEVRHDPSQYGTKKSHAVDGVEQGHTERYVVLRHPVGVLQTAGSKRTGILTHAVLHRALASLHLGPQSND